MTFSLIYEGMYMLLNKPMYLNIKSLEDNFFIKKFPQKLAIE